MTTPVSVILAKRARGSSDMPVPDALITAQSTLTADVAAVAYDPSAVTDTDLFWFITPRSADVRALITTAGTAATTSTGWLIPVGQTRDLKYTPGQKLSVILA